MIVEFTSRWHIAPQLNSFGKLFFVELDDEDNQINDGFQYGGTWEKHFPENAFLRVLIEEDWKRWHGQG